MPMDRGTTRQARRVFGSRDEAPAPPAAKTRGGEAPAPPPGHPRPGPRPGDLGGELFPEGSDRPPHR